MSEDVENTVVAIFNYREYSRHYYGKHSLTVVGESRVQRSLMLFIGDVLL
jgi:hypothetical protein